MHLKLDIFRQNADGTVNWVQAVETIEKGKAIIKEISTGTAGEYFILDLLSDSRIYITPNNRRAGSQTSRPTR